MDRTAISGPVFRARIFAMCALRAAAVSDLLTACTPEEWRRSDARD